VRQKQADPGPRQDSEQPVADGGASWRFRNWRVPTRLTAILLVPVLTGVTFAGLRVHDQLNIANAAGQNEKVAILVRDATTVVDDLENERDLAVAPALAGNRNDPAVLRAQKQTDADILTMYAAATSVHSDARISTELGNFKTLQAQELKALRSQGNSASMDPITTNSNYSNLFFELMGLDNELSFGNNNVNSRGRELYALTLQKASTSNERNLVTIALVADKMPTELSVGVQVANKLTQVANGQFVVSGIPSDLALYQKTVTAAPITPTEEKLEALGLAGKRLSSSGVTPASWYQDSSALIQQERQVESAITDQIVQDAKSAQHSADQQALIIGIEALAALLASALLTMVMSRSMVRGMRTLRNSAQEIAGERLPDLVRKLSKTDPERVDTTVAPIPLTGRDEIGEVARAFEDVLREAVRLASEQALLRGNVNAIFTNLSRRSHGLIERQLELISVLESNEADPDQLESLFKLDHLATRMRRNGENLLVLAGESAGREWTDPVPLVDVLRAAASEVEQYERVELSGIPEAEVIGVAVTDLVHLLAELLENATAFSSPQTRVRVTATRLPDQRMLVEIHDKGIGLTPEDFAGINSKLADPPTVDASVSRQMGLFVVGRLAERHGVRVQLRPSGESAGTTSLVMMPEHLTQLPRVTEPEETYSVSRVYPETEAETTGPVPALGFAPTPAPDFGTAPDFEPAAPAAPGFAPAADFGGGYPEAGGYGDTGSYPVPGLLTASELGFDDSRYEVPAPAVQQPPAPAAPTPRLRRLGQRRETAALEAAAPQPAPAPAPAPQARPTAPQPAAQPAAQPAPQRGFEGTPYADNGYPGGEFDRATGYDDEYPTTSFPAAAFPDAPFPAPAFPEPGYPEPGYRDSGYPAAFPEQPYQGGFQEQSYPAPDAGYEAGRYTAADFDSAAPALSPFTHDRRGRKEHSAPYQPEPQFNQPYYPETPQAPQAEEPRPSLPQNNGGAGGTGALPQRRPGQALGGRAIGERETGERPNWFTGAREDSGQSSTDAFLPTAPEAMRTPVAGGTTEAGLPRRVPRQNLLPGNVQEPGRDQAGSTTSQLSRTPEEVRGRLTNLRRGVQQGRSAGDSPHPDQHGGTDLFGGPNHPER